jgi:UDP-3-O-[3-hydroxymyristoyl] glucosamine N-acyltransferase
MRLSELARAIPDCVLDDSRGADPDIKRVAALDQAAVGDLSFLWSGKFRAQLATTAASALILDPTTTTHLPALRSERPRLVFARALAILQPQGHVLPGRHPTATVAATAGLAADVHVGPGVVIGERVQIAAGVQLHPNCVLYDDVSIGPRTVVHANCVIRERTVIGADCIIYPGAVLGNDGFGYELEPQGAWLKIPQTGNVVLEDAVEIGSLTAIDRPALGETRIGRGAKIDNLVQIGHGCKIGPYTLLVSQVGLAGGVETGHHVVLAGQVGVADHVSIGAGSTVGAKSGIPGNVAPGSTLMGYPVVPANEWKRLMAAERRLPELLRTVRELSCKLADLAQRLDEKTTGQQQA